MPFLQRPGVEEMASMATDLGMELVVAVRDFSSSEMSQSHSQLNIKAGDAILVKQAGTKGWKFGQILLTVSGKRLFSNDDLLHGWGAQGWFPETFVAAAQELATWRQRIIQIGSPDDDGTVSVVDASSGETIFAGLPEAPAEHWYFPAQDGER
uniref:SH3 domain-containing protein n=1 Tax=Guillardia theta (strain CCMP2712) TaxID=905079 RepID=A0A0C3SXF6_GUITC